MPNGGSDCCGTCWFNTVNNGQVGFPKLEARKSIQCEIRDFTPESPFYTYCANHPHHNPDKIRVPIGPVYVCPADSYSRVEKIKPPDSEAVRRELIRLLEEIPETPREEYPSQTRFYAEVIKHVGFIKESRAETALNRVLSFDPFACEEGNFRLNNVRIISATLETLAAVAPDTSLSRIRPWVTFELPEQNSDEYERNNDLSAPIRYHAVRALKDVGTSSEVISLLEKACQDPHPEIRAFANEILRLKHENR